MHQASRANKHQRLVKKDPFSNRETKRLYDETNKKQKRWNHKELSSVIYQKIKYVAPGTILQERKWYQLCSCVSKNFPPFVNTVGKFTTVTYIAGYQKESISTERLLLTPILTVAVKEEEDGIYNLLCQNSLKTDLFQVSI